MTEDDVIARLSSQIKTCGGITAWATANNIARSYVSEVLAKKKRPGPLILKAMGIDGVVVYRRVKP